jgi:hypothetical protein
MDLGRLRLEAVLSAAKFQGFFKSCSFDSQPFYRGRYQTLIASLLHKYATGRLKEI